MGVTCDSTFIIDLLRGRDEATRAARALLASGEARFLSTPVVFEVSAGLLARGARRQAAEFRNLAGRFAELPFDSAAARRAAEVHAEFRAIGRPKSHLDAMIAGTALAGGHSLITRDRDFDDISEAFGLQLQHY